MDLIILISKSLFQTLSLILSKLWLMHEQHSHPHPHQPHSHHGDHQNHSHGHGHHHGHGHAHGHNNDQSPEEYFKTLKQLEETHPELYWMEIIKGTVFDKTMEKLNLQFLRGIDCQAVIGVVGMAEMMLNCEWMPLFLKPFVSGMFFPLLLFIFINYNVLVGFNGDASRQVNLFIMMLPLLFFVLAALRTSGSHSTKENKQKAIKIYEIRPYLENPQLKCRQCGIPKSFRTMHCPICKICVPKFSRHSLIFGACIGAANELLAVLFFFALSLQSGYVLVKFLSLAEFGLLTKIMMVLINGYVFCAAFWEFFTFMTLNYRFGLTEFEVQNWIMMQYLMKVPARQFENNCNNGFSHNFIESVYAMIGAKGFESFQKKFYEPFNSRDDESGALNEELAQSNLLEFPEVDTSRKHVVNWDKAFMYLIPQMPNYPRRNDVINMMKRDEPKMIQNFKMIKQFKDEVLKENPNLNEMQVQQQAMMKMQQHIMKNGPPSHMKPNPQQQRVIQLQMLAHMKQQFPENSDIRNKLQAYESQLKSNTIHPDQVNMGMRQIQQEIMRTRMEEVIRQKQQQQKRQEMMKKVEQVKMVKETKPSELLQAQVEAEKEEELLIEKEVDEKVEEVEEKKNESHELISSDEDA